MGPSTGRPAGPASSTLAVEGTFDGNRGDFYGDDTLDGRPIKVHYIWSRTDTATPRWEQEFSPDGGQTWETNWIMDFSRP